MQAVLGPCRVILQNRNLRELLLCLVLLGLSSSFILPFFSLFATREVGMSPWLFSLFLISTSLSAVAVGTLLSRWSDVWLTRRFVLVLSCIGGVIGYAGYAYVRNVTGLFLLGCGVLSVSALTFSQLFAYGREQLARSGRPPAEAPLYMNVFRLTYALSWTVGPAGAAWVMVHHGFRGTFLAAALLYALLLVVILRVVAPSPPTLRSREAAQVPLGRTLRRPDILAHFIGFALLFCAGTMSMLNLPLLVVGTLQGSPRQVGLIFSVAPAFEIPLMFYFGLLASKGHQAALIRAGALIAAVYYLGLSLVTEPWQIYPLQILGAALVSITSGIAITFFQDYLPEQPGMATHLFSSASRVGAMIGYGLFGTLSERAGPRGLFFVCTALSVATAVLFFLRARRDARRPAGSAVVA